MEPFLTALWRARKSLVRFSQIGLGASTTTNDFGGARLALAPEPRDETQPLWLSLWSRSSMARGALQPRGPDLTAANL
jgi:hypothetical protein